MWLAEISDRTVQSLSIMITSSSSTPQSGDGLLSFCFCFGCPLSVRCGTRGTLAPPAPTGPSSRGTAPPRECPVPAHAAEEDELDVSCAGAFSLPFAEPVERPFKVFPDPLNTVSYMYYSTHHSSEEHINDQPWMQKETRVSARQVAGCTASH